jgi:hypothetical protein
MQREEKFLIVPTMVLVGFDHQEAVLTPILPEAEILHGHGVRVVPAKPRRSGNKRIAGRRPRRDWRRTFLHGAIDIRRDKQAVPVHHFGPFAPIGHLYRHGPVFFET